MVAFPFEELAHLHSAPGDHFPTASGRGTRSFGCDRGGAQDVVPPHCILHRLPYDRGHVLDAAWREAAALPVSAPVLGQIGVQAIQVACIELLKAKAADVRDGVKLEVPRVGGMSGATNRAPRCRQPCPHQVLPDRHARRGHLGVLAHAGAKPCANATGPSATTANAPSDRRLRVRYGADAMAVGARGATAGAGAWIRA